MLSVALAWPVLSNVISLHVHQISNQIEEITDAVYGCHVGFANKRLVESMQAGNELPHWPASATKNLRTH